MRKTLVIALAVVVGAFVGAAVARSAGVTVNSVVTGGATLSVTSLNAPSFPITLNGDDQTGTYQAQLQILDARGLAAGGGWNLTVSGTQYGDGSGHTLPATASTITSVSTGCHTATSTCALPTNSASNTNVALPVSPASKILNAGSGSGLGRIDVNVNVSVAVPASTIAGSYSTTLTFAISNGP
jgi:hypothetical protein